MTGETLLTILEDRVQDGGKGMTKDDPTAYCQHVRNTENSYLVEDPVMEIVVGDFRWRALVNTVMNFRVQ
jgi:hypothetical protein